MGCLQSKQAPSPPQVHTSDAPEQKTTQKTPPSNNTNNNTNNNNRNRTSARETKGELKEGAVEDTYDVGVELGRGAFSVVRKGIHKVTKEEVAIKFIEKRFVQRKHVNQLRREIQILKQVNHKNIIQLLELYETPTVLTMVTELVNGGELFWRISENGAYCEDDARSIVRQICQGVAYLHNSGIAHRDLKPENLLCGETTAEFKPFRVVIADFGLSKIYGGAEQLETSCGTPDYVAPEVLACSTSYDNSVDMWAVGVITYIILCGFPPFYNSKEHSLFEQIAQVKINFPMPEWSSVSKEAISFVLSIIKKEPKERLTAKECLEHPWLNPTRGVSGSKALLLSRKLSQYATARREMLNTYGGNVGQDSDENLNPLNV